MILGSEKDPAKIPECVRSRVSGVSIPRASIRGRANASKATCDMEIRITLTCCGEIKHSAIYGSFFKAVCCMITLSEMTYRVWYQRTHRFGRGEMVCDARRYVKNLGRKECRQRIDTGLKKEVMGEFHSQPYKLSVEGSLGDADKRYFFPSKKPPNYPAK